VAGRTSFLFLGRFWNFFNQIDRESLFSSSLLADSILYRPPRAKHEPESSNTIDHHHPSLFRYQPPISSVHQDKEPPLILLLLQEDLYHSIPKSATQALWSRLRSELYSAILRIMVQPVLPVLEPQPPPRHRKSSLKSNESSSSTASTTTTCTSSSSTTASSSKSRSRTPAVVASSHSSSSLSRSLSSSRGESSSSSSNTFMVVPPKRRLVFGHVEVYEFPVLVGDSPHCMDGCPMAMDYDHPLLSSSFNNKNNSHKKKNSHHRPNNRNNNGSNSNLINTVDMMSGGSSKECVPHNNNHNHNNSPAIWQVHAYEVYCKLPEGQRRTRDQLRLSVEERLERYVNPPPKKKLRGVVL
jgi:hypothetical protein